MGIPNKKLVISTVAGSQEEFNEMLKVGVKPGDNKEKRVRISLNVDESVRDAFKILCENIYDVSMNGLLEKYIVDEVLKHKENIDDIQEIQKKIKGY